MATWLRNHVKKFPQPFLCHSLPFPHILPRSLPVPPLIPTPVVSVCTGGASCCQWPFFHVNGLVLGVSGLPSPCSLKPCQVPGLLGAQGRDSPNAAKEPVLPLPAASPPPEPNHGPPRPRCIWLSSVRRHLKCKSLKTSLKFNCL